MAIRALSWNIEGRLGPVTRQGRGSPKQIVDAIKRLDADVVFLPEATIDGVADNSVDEQLESFGYSIHEVSYDDFGSRPYDDETAPTMRFLSRLAVSNFQVHRYGDIRSMIALTVEDPDTQLAIQLFGTHLDDRSRKNRLKQIPELASAIGDSQDTPFILGDLNEMSHSDIRSRLLSNPITKTAIRLTTWGLTGYTLRRLSEMADGTALRQLEQLTGLRSVDSKHRATVTAKSRDRPQFPSVPLFQIDHMLAGQGVTVENFTVHSDNGSDHRALSATLYLTEG